MRVQLPSDVQQLEAQADRRMAQQQPERDQTGGGNGRSRHLLGRSLAGFLDGVEGMADLMPDVDDRPSNCLAECITLRGAGGMSRARVWVWAFAFFPSASWGGV